MPWRHVRILRALVRWVNGSHQGNLKRRWDSPVCRFKRSLWANSVSHVRKSFVNILLVKASIEMHFQKLFTFSRHKNTQTTGFSWCSELHKSTLAVVDSLVGFSTKSLMYLIWKNVSELNISLLSRNRRKESWQAAWRRHSEEDSQRGRVLRSYPLATNYFAWVASLIMPHHSTTSRRSKYAANDNEYSRQTDRLVFFRCAVLTSRYSIENSVLYSS